MSHVTFETARRLKNTGFPQPEFASGQFWYNEWKALSIIGRREIADNGPHEFFICMSMETGRVDGIIPMHEGSFFAPTATDILRDLPGLLRKFKGHFQWGDNFVLMPLGAKLGAQCYQHETPAEACAAAWLALHEKN